MVGDLSAPARLDALCARVIEEFGDRRGEMRGLKRLSELTQRMMKDLDSEADAIADEMQAASDRAKGSMRKFRDAAVEIRRTADEVDAELGQISNVFPTGGDGDDSERSQG
jgi:methyl-accepting chemotaxis protein